MARLEDKQKLIDECFNTKWSVVDFYYAYLDAHDIDEDDLTDEQATEIEGTVADMITYEMVRGLHEIIIEDINERLRCVMGE